MAEKRETIEGFASLALELLKSDRMVIMGTSGFPGEGKTRFSDAFLRAYAVKAKTHYDFDRMTWSRKEVMKWIDGEGKEKTGQLKEFSAIHIDELFAMFYKRNWYEKEQIDAITTFNMCRDRHLLLCGNVPDFWDLDGSFTSRIMFYVFIPYRGVAWVFKQEVNPWSNDPWNRLENKKAFRRKKDCSNSPNYVCTIFYDDWTYEEKEAYYTIRNEKRREAVYQNKSEQKERYANVKAQRDMLIRAYFMASPKTSLRTISEMTGLSQESIRLIKEGLR